MLEGESVRVHRGDLEVPISASGRIEPASITKIKGEASGEVKLTPQRIGGMVRAGELIIGLDPEDEQRNVDRAEADYERTVIALDRAKLARQETETVGLPMAQADLAQTKARWVMSPSSTPRNQAKLARSEDISPAGSGDRQYQLDVLRSLPRRRGKAAG